MPRKRKYFVDKRGKHTKKDRELKKYKLSLANRNLVRTIICSECNISPSSFRATEDGDAMVCTNCGLVGTEKYIEGIPDYGIDPVDIKSMYLHRNYFAEKIKQAMGTDPKFKKRERVYLRTIIYALAERDPETWHDSANFTRRSFSRICRILNRLRPGNRWTTKQEKYVQARRLIYQDNPDFEILDEETGSILKALFDVFSWVFEKYFKDKECYEKKHNIPRLNYIILCFLYSLNPKLVTKYGWLFYEPNTANFKNSSVKKNFDNIQKILDKLYLILDEIPVNEHLPLKSKQYYYQYKIIIPDLKLLKKVVCQSPSGYNNLVLNN